MKAEESGHDPLQALLDFRNTTSENMGLSPAQIMFGRRTRTCLPTTSALLSTPSAAEAKQALTTSKQRQASCYNGGAKERPILLLGPTVRVRLDDND